MKAFDLIKILEKYPKAEIYVNAWSSSEDYDRTPNIKVCRLRKKDDIITENIICDNNTEYWNNEIK